MAGTGSKGTHTRRPGGGPLRRRSSRRRHSSLRRRSPSRRRGKSLRTLLDRQPKTFARHEDYSSLITLFRNSARLQTLTVSPRCWSLLNTARIDPDNLYHFYRTYRLPEHPFFPLFLRLKRDYFAERERIRAERRVAIRGIVRTCPEYALEFLRYLGHLEDHYNAADEHPLWQSQLYPSSKKAAREAAGRNFLDWIATFGEHLEALAVHYRDFSRHDARMLLSAFVLGCPRDDIPPRPPGPRAVARAYRRESLRHHPDRGGDAAMFIELKKAKDTLQGKA